MESCLSYAPYKPPRCERVFISFGMQVGPRCGVSFPASKRSVPAAPRAVARQPLKKEARRQTVDPLDTLDDTVTCARSVYKLLQRISTQTCQTQTIDSDNEQCWNGTDIGK